MRYKYLTPHFLHYETLPYDRDKYVLKYDKIMPEKFFKLAKLQFYMEFVRKKTKSIYCLELLSSAIIG